MRSRLPLFIVFLLLFSPFSSDAASLTLSCALGDVAAVRSSLAGGVDPNIPDEYGLLPLYCTVRAGLEAPLSMHLEILRLLVAAGAEVDAPAPDGETPLVLSLRKGAPFTEVTDLLLELGADPNGLVQGERPLDAVVRGAASIRQLEALLSHGADVRLKNAQGCGPLISAVASPYPSPEKVRRLLDAGADVNESFTFHGDEGATPLMAAAAQGAPELVRVLLEHGALMSLSSRSGRTARDYALRAGREDNATLLR